jgi:hypothetical protein
MKQFLELFYYAISGRNVPRTFVWVPIAAITYIIVYKTYFLYQHRVTPVSRLPIAVDDNNN